MHRSIYSSIPVEQLIILIVLQEQQSIFIRAHKLSQGLIPSLTGQTLVMEVYRKDAEKKLLPHVQFDSESRYVKVAKTVTYHDLLTGAILFEDGTTSHDEKEEILTAPRKQRTPVIVRKGWYQAPNGEWTNEPPAVEEIRHFAISKEAGAQMP